MNRKIDKNIPWKLFYNDTFTGDHSEDKHGNDITEGFYRLWFHTLLESITDSVKNTGYGVLKAPCKGFNFFRLYFEYNDEPQKIELDSDSYISELYRLKSIIFSNYKGYDLADDKKQMLYRFAECHCRYFLNGERTRIYEEIADTCKIENLDNDILSRVSMEMLSRCIELYPDDIENTEDTFLNSEKPSGSNSRESI